MNGPSATPPKPSKSQSATSPNAPVSSPPTDRSCVSAVPAHDHRKLPNCSPVAALTSTTPTAECAPGATPNMPSSLRKGRPASLSDARHPRLTARVPDRSFPRRPRRRRIDPCHPSPRLRRRPNTQTSHRQLTHPRRRHLPARHRTTLESTPCPAHTRTAVQPRRSCRIPARLNTQQTSRPEPAPARLLRAHAHRRRRDGTLTAPTSEPGRTRLQRARQPTNNPLLSTPPP